jgi:crotonobetainyl-CoA:carnitine CoA-transferase CaiB-like acyl-CoA transferase
MDLASEMTMPRSTRPLQGLLVIDFSTLLPGPLATEIFAQAGVRVVKVENPGGGDEMRN